MRKLFDAGMRVFGRRRSPRRPASTTSSHAARTSHGTFYLYFANKEDLLRALAVDYGSECLSKLADRIGPITPDEQGFGELHAFLAEFGGDVSPRTARSSTPGWRIRSRTPRSTAWASRR